MEDERFAPARIKLLREAKGITQEELGKRVGCTRQAIQQIEIGHNTPSVDTLEKIAKVFKAKVGFFFDQGGGNGSG